MVKDKKIRVLFLCTGNSARSIIAEALLNHLGGAEFEAYSAGSKPKGQVNPFALEVLARNRVPARGAHSKSWDDYGGKKAPAMEIVVTVCDNAAAETCPVWPGHPLSLHWGLPDPAVHTGTLHEKREIFQETFDALEAKILDFLALAAKNPTRESFLEELKENRLEHSGS